MERERRAKLVVKETNLIQFGPGQFFGEENALILEAPSPYKVTCCSIGGEILCANGADFMRILNVNPVTFDVIRHSYLLKRKKITNSFEKEAPTIAKPRKSNKSAMDRFSNTSF